jgi:hypothetical protein
MRLSLGLPAASAVVLKQPLVPIIHRKLLLQGPKTMHTAKACVHIIYFQTYTTC